MSELQPHHSIFIQQRLYNYGSIVLALGAFIATALLIKIQVSVPWVAVLSFIAFYGLTVMGSRVRTNPLIRCTIENADGRLYSNLWMWSLFAAVVCVVGYLGSSYYLWINTTPVLEVKQFVLLVAINASLMITAAFE